MPWWVWLSVAFFVVVFVGFVGVLFVLALRVFRQLGTTRRAAFSALDGLASASEAVGRRAEHLEERTAAVALSVERLRTSLDRLGVLRWALRDATSAVAQLRGGVPRK
jgi:hypothetical protein